jgi:hypothetical protein
MTRRCDVTDFSDPKALLREAVEQLRAGNAPLARGFIGCAYPICRPRERRYCRLLMAAAVLVEDNKAHLADPILAFVARRVRSPPPARPSRDLHARGLILRLLRGNY